MGRSARAAADRGNEGRRNRRQTRVRRSKAAKRDGEIGRRKDGGLRVVGRELESKERCGLIDQRGLRGDGILKSAGGRLSVRSRPFRNFGDAVAAAGAGEMAAVGEEGLTGANQQFVASPVDLVAESVGDIGKFGGRELDDVSCRQIKIGIMLGDDGIRGGSRLQSVKVGNATSNHGIRVDERGGLIPMGYGESFRVRSKRRENRLGIGRG